MASESIYTCRTCSTEFISQNVDAKYCSWECKRRGMLCADPEKCKQLYQEGKSQRAIAQMLGVSQRAVINALRFAGVACRPRKVELDSQLVRKLYLQGNPAHEIGSRFGVSKEPVLDLLHREGIKIRKRNDYSRQLAGLPRGWQRL